MEDKKFVHHKVDFERLEDFEELLAGDDLYCCLGTTRAKAGSKEAFRKVDFTYPFEAAKHAKVKQFLLVSSVGADHDSPVNYLKVKGELQEALKDLDFWALHIFKPSMLDGKRKEFRLGEVIGARLIRGASFLSGGRLIPGRFLPVEDITVARAMVHVAQGLNPGVHIYESEALERLANLWGGTKKEMKNHE